jgi:uncharacterized protein YndB with AHSA1/START domain
VHESLERRPRPPEPHPIDDDVVIDEAEDHLIDVDERSAAAGREGLDAARERVFDYLADIANHAEFTDHFLKDFRLERLDSRGVGAAASFRIACRLASLWAEAVLTEVERPYRIVAEGQTGRLGRIKIRGAYTLTPHNRDMTRVELTFSSEPATRTDYLRELLAARPSLKRQTRRALHRLRFILEEGEPSAHAVRPAAG